MQASGATEAPEQDAEPAENLGVRLRRAREAQELSYDVISAELRISAESLEALEECRFDALGPAVFAKGYLKQYAARLGLDVPAIVAEYERMAGAGAGIEIAPSRTIRLRDDRQVTIWIVAFVVLLLIAGILGVWWWLGRDLGLPGTAESAAVSSLTGSTARAAPAGDRGGSPVSSSATGTRIEAESGSVAARPEAPPAVGQTRPGPAAAVEPDEAARAAEAAAGASNGARAAVPDGADAAAIEPARNASAEPFADAAATAAPPTGPTLEVRFVADSWTDITDETGERLYYGLGRAGTRATVPADRKLNLFFGYADGVSLSIDGEPFPIPASARRRGDLAQFDLDARVSQNR
jgi:cytoskeleton protein RodZ